MLYCKSYFVKEKMTHTLCIGITGNFASGKTTVANYYESLNYPVVYTDALAKSLMQNNSELKLKLINEFGSDIFLPSGELNSTLLAKLVFNHTSESEENLNNLNMLVHPYVIDEMIKHIEEYENAKTKLVFVESALIYEAGLDKGFDYIICVNSNIENIINRAEKKSISKDEVLLRLSRQMPAKEKSDNADFTIENNGTLDELKKSALMILNIINSIAESETSL